MKSREWTTEECRQFFLEHLAHLVGGEEREAATRLEGVLRQAMEGG